jgi:hypothetical protein
MEMVEEEAQRSRMGWEEAGALLVQSERVERALGRQGDVALDLQSQ